MYALGTPRLRPATRRPRAAPSRSARAGGEPTDVAPGCGGAGPASGVGLGPVLELLLAAAAGVVQASNVRPVGVRALERVLGRRTPRPSTRPPRRCRSRRARGSRRCRAPFQAESYSWQQVTARSGRIPRIPAGPSVRDLAGGRRTAPRSRAVHGSLRSPRRSLRPRERPLCHVSRDRGCRPRPRLAEGGLEQPQRPPRPPRSNTGRCPARSPLRRSAAECREPGLDDARGEPSSPRAGRRAPARRLRPPDRDRQASGVIRPIASPGSFDHRPSQRSNRFVAPRIPVAVARTTGAVLLPGHGRDSRVRADGRTETAADSRGRARARRRS